jgi:hypothetical protein
MVEAMRSSERRFLQEPHGVNIPEDAIFHSHLRENLKSYLETSNFRNVLFSSI